MSDKSNDYLKRLQQFDYRGQTQFLHDIILSEQLITRTGSVLGAGDIVSFIVPQDKTFFLLSASATSSSGIGAFSLDFDGTIVDNISSAAQDKVLFTCPAFALIGDGVRVVKIENTGLNAAIAFLCGYLETTFKTTLNLNTG